jgi:hypothetical protein
MRAGTATSAIRTRTASQRSARRHGALLLQMTSDQITIALGGELDPGLVRPLTGDDYLGVVMPMRI